MSRPFDVFIKYYTGWHCLASRRRKEEALMYIDGLVIENAIGVDGCVVKLPKPVCISYNSGPQSVTRLAMFPDGKLAAVKPDNSLFYWTHEAPTWTKSI